MTSAASYPLPDGPSNFKVIDILFFPERIEVPPLELKQAELCFCRLVWGRFGKEREGGESVEFLMADVRKRKNAGTLRSS